MKVFLHFSWPFAEDCCYATSNHYQIPENKTRSSPFGILYPFPPPESILKTSCAAKMMVVNLITNQYLTQPRTSDRKSWGLPHQSHLWESRRPPKKTHSTSSITTYFYTTSLTRDGEWAFERHRTPGRAYSPWQDPAPPWARAIGCNILYTLAK